MNSNLFFILVTLCMFLPTIGCGNKAKTTSESQSSKRLDWETFYESPKGKEMIAERLEYVFSKKGMAVLERTNRIEIFKITDLFWEPEPANPIGKIDVYPVTAKGEIQESELISQLTHFFLQGRNYCYVSPDSIPNFKVVLRFWGDKDILDLIIDPHSKFLSIFVRDSSEKKIYESGGSFSSSYMEPDPFPELMQKVLSKLK